MLLDRITQQIADYSTAEAIAVLLAIAYLILVIRQNIWCWFCAGISSAIYVWLFFGARLYMESGLYLFYALMAVYGWRVWNSVDKGEELPVSEWPLLVHVCAVGLIVALSALAGWLLHDFTDAVYPYVDSFTTFAAIWATFLVARKVFENWWYWLVIDAMSVAIYWSRELELTALLFVFYLILIPFGMAQWRKSFRRQQAAAL